MSHDALSRALNGQRHFSAVELASLAELLDVDTHWLITGETDPFKVRLAARHLWADSSDGQRQNDDDIIARVVETYRTAYAGTGKVPSSVGELPRDPSRLRKMLGVAYAEGTAATGSWKTSAEVRYLADQVQNVLSVDIVRDPGLQTDYSFRIGEHAVVLLKSTTRWFRANWSIAHELAHLALGHHDGQWAKKSDEAPANAFAGEFLLPADQMRSVDWASMDKSAFALWLWDAGVSTQVMRHRIRELNLQVSEDVREAANETTPQLMRAHLGLIWEHVKSHNDPIWERENATTGRQFPEHLVAALTRRVEAGQADPNILAWVREVPVDDLDWPEPDIDAEHGEASERSDETDWFGLLDAR